MSVGHNSNSEFQLIWIETLLHVLHHGNKGLT